MTSKSKPKYLIGCDPEFFLMDTKSNLFVSAHDKVPGTKKAPHKLKYGAVQRDGLSVEINILPASTAEEFSHNVVETLREVRKMIPKQYTFMYQPSVHFQRKVWDLIPDEVKELGCDPDFSIDTGAIRDAPIRPENRQTMCTGSGHIHLGWTSNADTVEDVDHLEDCRLIARSFEFLYGQSRQYFESTFEDRNIMYSRIYRPKSYGVEQRSPSNAWLATIQGHKLLFAIAMETLLKAEEGVDMSDYNSKTNRIPSREYNKARQNYLNSYSLKKVNQIIGG